MTKRVTGPGRPRNEAGSPAVREALLQAARTYFSYRGFQQASLRKIAAAAHVNPAMVHYYFGNKEGLYIAMLSETAAPLIEELESLNAGGAGREGLQAFLRHYARTLLAEPWLPNLLVREVLFQEGKVRDTFIARFASRVGTALRGLVGRDVDSGELPPHIDPTFGALGVMSLILFPFIAQPAVEQVFQQHIDEKFVERLTRHTVALLYGTTNEHRQGEDACGQE